jgi:alpha-beta hydrolase superfamily lysophospholipase
MGTALVILAIVVGGLAAVFGITVLLIAHGFALPGKGVPCRTPAEFGVPYEDVTFPSSDGHRINAWYLKAKSDVTIVVMHGGRAHRDDEAMDLLGLCASLAKRGFNVLTLDRRGCGHSARTPFRDRARLERDFAGAVSYLRTRFYGSQRIFLFGNSVGAMAAMLYTAAHPEAGVRGIVADSAFATNMGIAKRVLNGGLPGAGILAAGSLWFGEKLFGLPREDAVDVVGRIRVPILFILGDSDKEIPVSDTDELLKASRNPADEKLIVPGATHSLSYRTAPDMVIDRVAAFVRRNRA